MKKRPQIRSSIRTKLLLFILLMIILFIGLNILFTSVMLKPYYKWLKGRNLIESYESISQIDLNDENIDDMLCSIEEQENIQVLMLSEDGSVFFCSRYSPLYFRQAENASDGQSGEKWFKRWLLPQKTDSFYEQKALFSFKPIISLGSNELLGTKYITLLVKLKDGSGGFYYTVIIASMASLDEGVNAGSRFAVGSGFLMLIIVCVTTFIVVRRFTDPMLELSKTAQNIARLDFSHKLDVKGNDELALLAKSINTLSDELELKINELRLANDRLKSDVEELDRMNRRRGELMSNISHDLKTPLSIILGYTEAVQSCENADDRAYYCTVIEEEALRMSSLSSRLLRIEELSSGANALTLSVFSLPDLIAERLEKFIYISTERNITATLVSNGDCHVCADAERIEEVVNNLLSNAYNYTPDGGRINMSVSRENDEVICRIFNSGSSIPEESLTRVWESFYKVDKARTGKYGGAGLGLKIVSTIIELHSGRYGVENTEDGVVFFFVLKASDSEDPNQNQSGGKPE